MAGENVPRFPTYAELTQTQAWADKSAAIAVPTASVSGARYTEGAVLGVGGMGKVVLARDARIGRDVAVKVLHGERELSADERARFLREAQVQGQLEHPSIVPVYDIDQRTDGSTFFTMRRVIGRTLHAIIDDLYRKDPAATARYTQRELLTAFATVCLTIDYAHSRGVIHRDLKPANIMLGDFGEVYVLDWGLARLVEAKAPAAEPVADEPVARLSIPGEMMGTPMYMAPEQMSNPDVGPTADVFALGSILFEILTLQLARDAAALFAPVDARPSVRAPELRIAPELETICVRATEHEPANRYPTPRALHEALVRFLEGDRELEQRRVLAVEYAQQAEDALARADEPGADHDTERTTAVRKLRHALALDPANSNHVAMLAKIITTPPRTVPAEVIEEMSRQGQRLVATGARYSVVASSMWFLFLPLVMWMGIRQGYQTALVLSAAALATVLSLFATRQRHIWSWLQLAVIGSTILGAAFASTMYGPLVLVPTLTATFTIVIQAHPSPIIRGATWAMGCVALIVVSLIELASPSSYLVVDGMLAIVPRMLELPRTESILLLLGASLGMTIVPCLFIARIRDALTEAQQQILVQAWQFRRFGEDLMTAAARPSQP